MSLYRDEGVVLRTIRLGEADRIVTLATPEHGKVRAVAKGVRKTKSRLGGRVEPLSHVSMLCWRGRELDTITQVEVLDHFRPIREDLDRMSQAMTMLEVVDQVAVERHAMPELFRMLVGALRSLSDSYSPFVAGAFLWKLLTLEGLAPVVDRCAGCGSQTAELVAFDVMEDGFLCRSCRRGQGVRPGTVELVRRILGGDLARVLAEPPSPESLEMEKLAIEAVEHHLDRRLRVPRAMADTKGQSPQAG
ncbi:MAG TPA: DNA repair protein RecO [Acidimicrobiales bacterium]|nr:DNA repair protein RecO [Acidimicrobiales bacterium]